MQSIKALSLYLCECLFVGGRVYLCCEQRAHIRVCRGQWATLDAAPQEPSTLFPEAVSCWPAPHRLAGQLASSRDPVSLLSAGFKPIPNQNKTNKKTKLILNETVLTLYKVAK